MTEPNRDWEKELADIDRVIARQQGALPPPSTPVPSAPGAPPATPAAPDRARVAGGGDAMGAAGAVRRRSVVFAWVRVGLAVLLGAALALWPYPKGCGLQLAFFLGAAGAAAAVALWAAVGSWAYRRGVAHVLALLVLAWAAVAVAGEVLPRVGYARRALPWACPAPSPAPPVQR